MAVVMRTSFSICVNGDRTRPQLLGTHAGKINGGLAVHTRRLCGVAVELVALDDTNTVVLPGGFVAMRVRVRLWVNMVSAHDVSLSVTLARQCRTQTECMEFFNRNLAAHGR